MSLLNDDTIVAISTPMGRGATALVRLSGKDAHTVARQLIKPWPARPRAATLCSTGVDRAVVTVYNAPSSFTGEDMVEISTHGGFMAPSLVMAELVKLGGGTTGAAGAVREALPGEFTRRAVLNGKIDLIQAEAIGDMIDARSTAQHSAALQQLDGGLSKRIGELRNDIIGLESLIAYDIDFPEEDDGPVESSRIVEKATALMHSLGALLNTAGRGELVREGAIVVIAGPPNVGKSSLFNALIGRSRAIVTDIPGTTRDAIEAVIDGENWPLRIVDTAGLRETSDVVERIGIETSERYLKNAHIVLACGDSEESVLLTVTACRNLTEAPVIPVQTKADLNKDHRLQHLGDPHHPRPALDTVAYHVSAETGTGLRNLLSALDEIITQHYGGNVAPDVPLLTRARHETAVRSALGEVEAFITGWRDNKVPAPIAAIHLRAASVYLEELIGAIDTEDVLDKLFSSFCVGK